MVQRLLIGLLVTAVTVSCSPFQITNLYSKSLGGKKVVLGLGLTSD